MPLPSDADLQKLLAVANAWRRGASEGASDGREAEARLDEAWRHSLRLAVYGSLAPGRQNHHVLANCAGRWSRGRVRGDLINAGWGAAGGFPGLRPRVDGPWVDVHVLESRDLARSWQHVDDFEGVEYRRILIPVYGEDGNAAPLAVANIYEVVL